MAKYNHQKAKILYLRQMLCETGEGRTISMQQILDNLQDKGIRAERKSIYDDMEVLRYFGMNIEYRRERPTGYYLAEGGEPVTDLKEGAEEPVSRASEKPIGPHPDPEAWLQYLPEADPERQMKLSCTEEGRELALRYFGGTAQVKEREDGEYLVSAPLLETPEFFGWLTAMAREVRLQKPKKLVQTYRDYLKGIARSYKPEK